MKKILIIFVIIGIVIGAAQLENLKLTGAKEVKVLTFEEAVQNVKSAKTEETELSNSIMLIKAVAKNYYTHRYDKPEVTKSPGKTVKRENTQLKQIAVHLQELEDFLQNKPGKSDQLANLQNELTNYKKLIAKN